ncbi:efflux RND transporter permease subunit [Vibrio lamellibrachiae]|uniref:efflux RND transporter permease subunit n=1 Tax=Vibrio lamellibrachiae TaxID=2910253 RepID=UPI003D0BD019
MSQQRGIIAWFAHNPVAANLIMWLLIIGGLFSVFTLNKEVFPTIETNFVQVTVAYPGAAPQEIEEGINIKIEEAIKDIRGIKQLSSVAADSVGTVTVEVDSGYKPKDILDEIKLEVDSISTFPDSIENPNIFQIKPKNLVMFVSIYGDLTDHEMKELAKQTRDEFTSLPAVSSADLIGALDYEIAIEVREQKLREFGLTFNEVAQAVQRSSFDLPGGSIRADDGNILLRTKAQAYRESDFTNIVVAANADGSRILLSQVADVRDGFIDWDNYVRFNGYPAAIIQVNSVDSQDAVEISTQVNAWLDEHKKALPDGVFMDSWLDLTHYLDGRLDMMISNIVFGAILVFAILALFLNVKLAFWVMMGLPVCFLGAFFLMPHPPFGVTLNMVSLFAFILVLGIVVDDAIVTGESAAQEIEKNGHSVDSVVTGVRKVATPATFGVLTTMVAFIPMLMISGPMKSLSEAVAWVVILCLVFSLIESKLILPAHLAHMKLNPNKKPNRFVKAKQAFNGEVNRFVVERYKPFLELCIQYRYRVLAVFFGVLMLSVALVMSGKVRWVFFPDMPSDYIHVTLEMEPAFSEARTIETAQLIEKSLHQMDEKVTEEFGHSVVDHYLVVKASLTNIEFFVELSKAEDRQIDGVQIADKWRAELPTLVGVNKLSFDAGGGAQTNTVTFELASDDLDALTSASEELKEKLALYNGLYDVSDNFSSGSSEIRLQIKPEAEALGLSLLDLASQVRHGFFGYEAQRLLRDKEEVKVMVRYPREERRSIGHLENMLIRTPSGESVPFSTVAEVELDDSYSSINRKDNRRALTIVANVNTNVAEPKKVVDDVLSNFVPELTEKYDGLSVKLGGASLDEQESMVALAQGALFVLLAVYTLLAIPLKSYTQPMIIMSVIPFGMIGALFGHLFLGLSMSMLSMTGIIALGGVVVNDSLVLVDYVNRARSEGRSIAQAAIDSGCFRFRAVILTSLTTFFGLVPMMLETSLQAQVMVPMAVSLAFGILFSTFVTLLLVPILYLVLNDIKSGSRKFYQWWWQPESQ